MWITHFNFFDLGYDIWRENDEDVLGVQPGGTMQYLEEIVLLSKKKK